MNKDRIKPQGCAEDAPAQNANIEPFDIAGVDTPTILCANDDEINKTDDNDEDIMSIATIPPANNPNPLVLLDALDNNDNDDESSNDDESKDNNSLQGGNPGMQGETEADKPEDDPTEGQDQGVQQLKRRKKGTTGRYKDYSLMMNV